MEVTKLPGDTRLLNWLQDRCVGRFWVWTGVDLISYPKRARPGIEGMPHGYDVREVIRKAMQEQSMAGRDGGG